MTSAPDSQPLPPPPTLQDDDALLLDFDGTLVAFAPTPDTIMVPDELPSLLRRLRERVGGALAFVTGRAIDNLDQHVSGGFDIVGAHGAEWRIAGTRDKSPGEPFDEALAMAQAFAKANHGVLIQEKVGGFTIHFRGAPHVEGAARSLLAEAFAQRDDFEIISGAAIWEARRKGDDKGAGVRRLMESAPYAGRRPVFIGDDRTDEDGHRATNALDGVSIKVGPEATDARYRLDDIEAVYAWLRWGAGS